MSIVDRRSIACVLADPVVVMAMGANPGRSGAGDCAPSTTSILTPVLGGLPRVTVVCRSPVDVAVEVYDGYRGASTGEGGRDGAEGSGDAAVAATAGHQMKPLPQPVTEAR